MNRSGTQSGVTLIEMLIVVGIVGLMASLTFPSFNAGLDGLRLRSAASSVASALNVAMNTAERRQMPVQVAILLSKNQLVVRAAESKRDQVFELSSGVKIKRILPALFLNEETKDRYIIVYPNGVPPQLVVELETLRGSSRKVALDPITGVAKVMDAVLPQSQVVNAKK